MSHWPEKLKGIPLFVGGSAHRQQSQRGEQSLSKSYPGENYYTQSQSHFWPHDLSKKKFTSDGWWIFEEVEER